LILLNVQHEEGEYKSPFRVHSESVIDLEPHIFFLITDQLFVGE